MRHIIIFVVEWVVVFVLVITFLVAVVIGILTYHRPHIVISLLEQLVPSATPPPKNVGIKGVAVLGDSMSD